MRLNNIMRGQQRVWLAAVIAALAIGLLALTPIGTRTAAAQASCGTNVTYIVARGDTLFRIARRFGTTMGALQHANHIANINRIFVGQPLVIACASAVQPPVIVLPPVVVPPGGFVVVPPPVVVTPVPPIVVQPPSIPGAFCGGFRATSPLGGLAFGNNTFFWDGAPGATSYRVNVFNVDEGGRLAVSFTTFAPNTNLTGDVGGPAGGGFRFAWEVEAIFAGQVICRTPRQTMFRASPPPAPEPTPVVPVLPGP